MGLQKDYPWMARAKAMLGTREGAGASDNPAVVRLYKDAGAPGVAHDAVAWCAAFVGAMLARAGIKPNGQLAARSYETFGLRLRQPYYGCIGIKRRSGRNAPAWQGHVGFVVAANATTVWMLGGNQGDKVCIAPFKRSEFTAFRWPVDTSIVAVQDYLPSSPNNASLTAVSEA